MKCLKRNVFGAAVVALGMMMICAAPAAANRLNNPGFEGPPIAAGGTPPIFSAWEPFGAVGPVLPTLAATGSVMPRTGANHLELVIDNFPNGFAGAFQDVLLPAGSPIIFSGWAKSLGVDPLGSEIRIEYRDSVGDFEISRTANLVPALTAAYQQFSISDVMPVGSDLARVVYAIQSFGAGPDQVIYVDDISVVVPEPASIALMGLAGFAIAAMRRRM